MHEGVDLQLGVLKRLWRWLYNLLVDHLSHPGVQANLVGVEYRCREVYKTKKNPQILLP